MQLRLLLCPRTQATNFIHLLYCYKSIPPPIGSTKRRNHPPRLQYAAPCLSRPIRQRRIADLREYCTQTPSRHLCHSCTRISRARCPDRGSCGILGSRCDSVRSCRASVRVSPLNIGSDTSQPRPRGCSCTHGLVCREGPGPGRPLPRTYGHRQRTLASDCVIVLGRTVATLRCVETHPG